MSTSPGRRYFPEYWWRTRDPSPAALSPARTRPSRTNSVSPTRRAPPGVTVARLQKHQSIDQDRLQTFERTRDLAKREYERVRELYTQSRVGTQSNVDTAEMAYNNTNDAADQLRQQLDLMPLRIQEAKSSLSSAKALSGLAKANLDRTIITAPFDARIADVSIERGQYIGVGASVLTLADDSVLEISVPLNSRN